jgi:hypothetical protein
MRKHLKKVMAGATGFALVAAVAPVLVASPAGAVGTSQGAVTLGTTSGDSTTDFTISLPAFSACAEDSAAGGWTVTSFMVPTAVDLTTLTFDSGGPTPASIGGAYADFRQPLWNVGGDAYLSRQTVNASPPDPSGPIQQPGTFDFDPGYSAGDIPAGAYNIGIACVDETTAIQQFWSTPITVTSNPADPGTADISWTAGLPAAAPDAPVVIAPGSGASAVGNGQITVDVDPAATGGAPTSYDITVMDGATTVATRNVVSADPGGEAFTGLTNGTTYTVTATATNTTGTSTASAGVNFTPSVVHASPVVTASPGTGIGTVDVVWTAAGGSPTSYDVTISPAPTTGPATQNVLAAGPLTATFANLGTGVHTVTVTPLGYPAGESALPGSDTATPTSGDGTPATLIQTIQVQREQVNAIVFEQDCDGDTFLGGNGPLPYGTTTCIVDLGPAVLDGTGSYYEADGELWPIRVIDHRDTDKGWKITGQIDPLFVDGAKSFDANALGWDPKELSQSGPLANGYTMTVDEGPVVSTWSASQALKNGSILAQSVASGGVQRGLGTAIYSADLDIQIPISVASGAYSANITFTLVNLT